MNINQKTLKICKTIYLVQENFCQPCLENCAKCYIHTECMECKEGFIWNFESCEIDCTGKKGYIPVDLVCLPCTQDCEVCADNYYRLDNNCVTQCPNTHYLELDTCHPEVKIWFSGQGSPLGYLSSFHPITLNSDREIECYLGEETINFFDFQLKYQFPPQHFQPNVSVSVTCSNNRAIAKMQTIPYPEGEYTIKQDLNEFTFTLNGFNPIFGMDVETYLNNNLASSNSYVIEEYKHLLYLPYNVTVISKIDEQEERFLQNQIFEEAENLEFKVNIAQKQSQDRSVEFKLQIHNFWIKQIFPNNEIFIVMKKEQGEEEEEDGEDGEKEEEEEEEETIEQKIIRLENKNNKIQDELNFDNDVFYCRCENGGKCDEKSEQCFCNFEWIEKYCQKEKNKYIDQIESIQKFVEYLLSLEQLNQRNVFDLSKIMKKISGLQIEDLYFQLIMLVNMFLEIEEKCNLDTALNLISVVDNQDDKKWNQQPQEDLFQKLLVIIHQKMINETSYYLNFNSQRSSMLFTILNKTQSIDYRHQINIGQSKVTIPQTALGIQEEQKYLPYLPVILILQSPKPQSRLNFTSNYQLQILLTNNQYEPLFQEQINYALQFQMPKNDSQANIIECLYYNEDEWVKDGELIVNTESTSTCEIHHLSIFSIGRFVNENPTITESEEFEYYKLTGIFILITIVIFFGAISFWQYKQQSQHLQRVVQDFRRDVIQSEVQEKDQEEIQLPYIQQPQRRQSSQVGPYGTRPKDKQTNIPLFKVVVLSTYIMSSSFYQNLIKFEDIETSCILGLLFFEVIPQLINFGLHWLDEKLGWIILLLFQLSQILVFLFHLAVLMQVGYYIGLLVLAFLIDAIIWFSIIRWNTDMIRFRRFRNE